MPVKRDRIAQPSVQIDEQAVRELHRHILASVSDGIHVIDASGIVLVENAASVRMLGWAGDCLVGKPGHSTIHHHHADGSEHLAVKCPIYLTLQDGVPREVTDDVFWRQDGSCFPVEYRTAPLCDAAGRRYGVTVVFRDISERKHAEAMRQALHAIAEAAHDCVDLDALYRRVHEIIAGLLPAENFFVALLDEASARLRFPYFVDSEDCAPDELPLHAAGLTGEVVRTGAALLVTQELQRERSAHGHVIVGTDAIDWLGVPLMVAERVIGALVVQSYNHTTRYCESDRELLQFVSTQVATAIERKQREAELKRMAQYDSLTGLPNRALFIDRMQVGVARARRHGEGLALLYLDLDKFKPVNDYHGHDVGDALLREVAGRIRELLRACDTVARLGGDEFVVLLQPVSELACATTVAEKIRGALAEPFVIGARTLHIGTSIGVARYPLHGSDEDSLVRAADAAMYRAKRAGSNRFELAEVVADIGKSVTSS